MDVLHAAIALYLRKQRLPDQSFHCTRCHTIVHGGQGLYHLDELRQARECAYCYGASSHRAALGLAGDSAANVPSTLPLCKHCGTPITIEIAPDFRAILLSERVCADCYQPF